MKAGEGFLGKSDADGEILLEAAETPIHSTSWKTFCNPFLKFNSNFNGVTHWEDLNSGELARGLSATMILNNLTTLAEKLASTFDKKIEIQKRKSAQKS